MDYDLREEAGGLADEPADTDTVPLTSPIQ